MTCTWSFTPLGEAALLAEARTDDHVAANRAVLAAAAALEADPPPGISAVAPAIVSLLVCFDPLQLSHAAVVTRLRTLLTTPSSDGSAPGRVVHITVRYGGEDGPDLEEVAATLGLTPAEVVAAHTAQPLRVMMIGFAPGFPYLGPLPPALHLPRRATPRTAVPPGSVAIAAGLSGIYPAQLPGGWHLIGRVALRLFDPGTEPPALLAPGDLVQFAAAGSS